MDAKGDAHVEGRHAASSERADERENIEGGCLCNRRQRRMREVSAPKLGSVVTRLAAFLDLSPSSTAPALRSDVARRFRWSSCR